MDLGCYPLHMIRNFSRLSTKVLRASAEIGPKNIDIAMDVELELAGGATARMTCSMKKDAQLGASFLARGEHGELKVTNPVGPHWGNQLTVKIGADETSESVA